MMPRITILGTGYLGAAHAACLAELGFEVLGLDTDETQLKALAAGSLPFHEPGLEDLLRSGLNSGRLRFTTSYADAAEFGDIHFVCVGTPQRPDSAAADLSHLEACVEALAPRLTRPCLVVGKSTVPVGTAACWPSAWPGSPRPAPPPSWPGTPSSCARATPWPTPCGRTGSWPGSPRSGPRPCCARCTPGRWPPGCRSWSPTCPPPSWSRSRPTRSWPPRSRSSTRWPRSARPRAPTSCRWPRRWPTTTGSAGGSWCPGSGSAGAACPRTSGPSPPPPASSASTRSALAGRGGHDQPAAAGPHGGPGAGDGRRGQLHGRGARLLVQAPVRRHQGLPRARRGRDPAQPRRPGHGLRPGGHGPGPAGPSRAGVRQLDAGRRGRGRRAAAAHRVARVHRRRPRRARPGRGPAQHRRRARRPRRRPLAGRGLDATARSAARPDREGRRRRSARGGTRNRSAWRRGDA